MGLFSRKKEKEVFKNEFGDFNYGKDLPNAALSLLKENYNDTIKKLGISNSDSYVNMASAICNKLNSIKEKDCNFDEYGDLIDAVVILGSALGEVICRNYNWHWFMLGETSSNDTFYVVSPNKDYCISPIDIVYDVLIKNNSNKDVHEMFSSLKNLSNNSGFKYHVIH